MWWRRRRRRIFIRIAENSVRTDENCLETEENYTAIGIEAQVPVNSPTIGATSDRIAARFGRTEEHCAMIAGTIGGAEARK